MHQTQDFGQMPYGLQRTRDLCTVGMAVSAGNVALGEGGIVGTVGSVKAATSGEVCSRERVARIM